MTGWLISLFPTPSTNPGCGLVVAPREAIGRADNRRFFFFFSNSLLLCNHTPGCQFQSSFLRGTYLLSVFIETIYCRNCADIDVCVRVSCPHFLVRCCCGGRFLFVFFFLLCPVEPGNLLSDQNVGMCEYWIDVCRTGNHCSFEGHCSRNSPFFPFCFKYKTKFQRGFVKYAAIRIVKTS